MSTVVNGALVLNLNGECRLAGENPGGVAFDHHINIVVLFGVYSQIISTACELERLKIIWVPPPASNISVRPVTRVLDSSPTGTTEYSSRSSDQVQAPARNCTGNTLTSSKKSLFDEENVNR
jgi:hypothetical protein